MVIVACKWRRRHKTDPSQKGKGTLDAVSRKSRTSRNVHSYIDHDAPPPPVGPLHQKVSTTSVP
jgi:hypothetical protein